ncbi:cAMP-binding domain of CRP or a regulatory subunit of cAMP-dependent protein kinase [Dehalogenimonas formicexedens]|uniref:cAMP-binding domain of CRP or a regulatory subunit of cAMP-dependent protein kinase n=1 Tax=Dehalogenimonas formicexedens TaxID=1839801 RepID=A0A1P8F6X2_9CHLR|nr:Crp/Fnr family transcriptional regulator [Dehalogenimonas formicexedens]APV44175.1 cAMP-binding domain of CRP or a regulatory subunit of cAMP-dependent protein kinase [Dehalogenimonas formicexedens]
MDYQTASSALKSSFLFSSISDQDLADLLARAEEKQFVQGEYFFWEGGAPDNFFLLISGRVKVIKHGSQGRETAVAFFSPGEIFGEVAVLEDKPYPASAVALETSAALSINRQAFRDFVRRHPEVTLAMIGILSGRLREAQSRLHDLAGERVEQRLSRTLYRLYSKLGPELPFTRQDLADMSGTTLETTVRYLSRLKQEGIITSKRGLVVIGDGPKLAVLAEG